MWRGTPKTKILEYWNGDIPWIQSSDLIEHKVSNVDPKKKITEIGLQNSAAKLIPMNSIAIVTRVGVGKIGLIQYEYTTSQDFLSLSQLKINEWFGVYSLYNSLQKEPHKVQGTSIKGITKIELLDKTIILPSFIEEQSQIGNFFKQLDEAIAIQQQELDTLKQTKQGFLQKMFPKEGEFIPEIRFPEFGREWECYKLGEIVEVTMGHSPKGENYTKNPHDNILVQGNADIKNGWVVPRLWTTQITKVANKGDIILSVRAPVGDVGKTHYDVVIGRGVAAIKGNEFIYQLLLKMKVDDFWKKFSTGSTFESINSTDIKEATIRVPNELEQTKIGNFLKQLDETIALHEQELDILKETKKAFLQKMFV
ncbi:restriction endonuclease subunit S [Bacillus sp. OHL2]